MPLSEKRIEISNYVLRRILIMQYDKKHHINRQSKTILLETIFKDVRLEGISRNQSMDYRKFIVKVLNYYKALNFIKDYTEQKEGKKKMRQLGTVEVPSEAFTSILKIDSE